MVERQSGGIPAFGGGLHAQRGLSVKIFRGPALLNVVGTPGEEIATGGERESSEGHSKDSSFKKASSASPSARKDKKSKSSGDHGSASSRDAEKRRSSSEKAGTLHKPARPPPLSTVGQSSATSLPLTKLASTVPGPQTSMTEPTIALSIKITLEAWRPESRVELNLFILSSRRAKLFRFASENEPPEWKERGTGDVKLLKHRERGTIRLLMRRDKTLKICANHYLTPLMELKPNAGSDRAWVWNTYADYADEAPKPELLAIRFLNAENAQKFKAKFDECKNEVKGRGPKDLGKINTADKIAEKLEELSVKEKIELPSKEESQTPKKDATNDESKESAPEKKETEQTEEKQ
ncbi:uncharacterized protein [Ambystoma mexicanum]|uniref:uncharacterized protein n=1 Tax=Ambystoma mexicanum TaxID=8296 RepID=UPI0037E9C0D5